ncbi:hypothetical protein ILFOPFJJ_06772 [Ensifer psoraleae]|uniref:GntR family transcriptional regulator n=1 Tax=Sinorhizobium psoraleae TaxID=520838 RepID=UPI00156842BA|nr:GntR family transcriptional regulator [Sinorhizobium psoraleae]NRP75849.1 hypothetical protein [Sinorhizobium psoraleae]
MLSNPKPLERTQNWIKLGGKVKIYGRLKSLIVLQRTPWEQNRIAERFGVSTTPVREALILLANDGIIVKNGTRSYLTRALIPQDVQNDYQAAFAIAQFCIESAVERFVPTESRLIDSKSMNANAIGNEFEFARAICEYGVR